MKQMLIGMVVGFLLASWIYGVNVAAQDPWPAHEECTPELVEDYERREWLLFDLMMEVRECRERFGGCQPGTHWIEDEMERRYRAAHPYTPLTEDDLSATLP